MKLLPLPVHVGLRLWTPRAWIMITAFLLLAPGSSHSGRTCRRVRNLIPKKRNRTGPLPTPPIRNGPLDFLTSCDPRATYMNPILLAWALATRRARGRDGGAAG